MVVKRHIIKGAAKSYLTHCSCVVIGLFKRVYVGLHFLHIIFEKLNFCLSVLSVIFVVNQMFQIRLLTCVILLFKNMLAAL